MNTPLEHVSFRHQAWLQEFPLTAETVLDYFAWSDFYDRTCLNEQMKMQRMSPAMMGSGALILRSLKGIFYEVALAQPPSLFVVRVSLG